MKLLKLLKAFIMTVVMGVMLLIGGFFVMLKLYSANENASMISDLDRNPSIEDFIDAIGEKAHELGQANDLYASVMIAQAILESNHGRSGLAAAPNYNLFGIKGSYENQFVEFETMEDDGQGNVTSKIAKFRKYPSYDKSLEDYVTLLRGGLSWNKDFYQATFKSNADSYRDVTAFLTGTYATDSRYDEKLNRLIEQYDLERYD